MIEKIEPESSSLTTYSIQMVAEKLKLKKIESAKKWLLKNDIQIHRSAKSGYVYQVEVDCCIDKPYVMNLRRKHPQKWKEIYRSVVNNLAVYNLMMIQLEGELPTLPITKVTLRSKADENIYKELMK
jgi:hypothetical protein